MNKALHCSPLFSYDRQIRIAGLFQKTEVKPLLTALITAGARSACITDNKGDVVWSEGEVPCVKDLITCLKKKSSTTHYLYSPIYYEGESVGSLVVMLFNGKDEVVMGALMNKTLLTLSNTIKSATISR